MGRLVQLWKIKDTSSEAIYRYGPDSSTCGELAINKATGVITNLAAVRGMSEQDSWSMYGKLAHAKAKIVFNAREYPNDTFIGS